MIARIVVVCDSMARPAMPVVTHTVELRAINTSR
jgi:hypothetical protein